jgi:hypothetical protein
MVTQFHLERPDSLPGESKILLDSYKLIPTRDDFFNKAFGRNI